MKINKHISFLVWLIFSCIITKAQTGNTSLDSAAVFSYLNKAEEYFGNADYTNALLQCEKARQLSVQKKFARGEAYALIKMNDVLIESGNYNSDKIAADAVIRIGNKIKDSLITAIGYMHIAQVNMYANRSEAAIENFEKALNLKLIKAGNDYTGLAWNDLGYTYGQRSEAEKQTDCFLKALRVYEKIDDKAGMAMVYNNLSAMHNSIGQIKEAIEYGKKAVALREKLGDLPRLSVSYCNLCQYYLGIDSAAVEKYRELCAKTAELTKDERRIIQAYVTSGLILDRQGKGDEGFKYELKAIALLEKQSGKDPMLARRYIAAGIRYSEHRLDSLTALNYFDKSIAISKELKDKGNLRDAYLNKTIFFKIRGDYYNAYENIKKYFAYKDSVVSDNTQADIAELETRYQTEKKDQQIIQLNADQKIKQLEIEKQKAIISGNLLLAKQKQSEIDLLSKTKALQDLTIQQQSEQIEKQLLVAQNNQQQLKLADQAKLLQQQELQNQKQQKNFLIAGSVLLLLVGFIFFNRYQLKRKLQQQKELLDVRNNIAKDLHDEVGSTLTSIKILSEVSQNNILKDQQKASGLIKKITEQSSQMQQGMSDIVWAIKPDNDKLENMLVRMREFASHTLEPKNINVVFSVDENSIAKHIGMQQRHDLFMIFKEAVNNAAKYAKCSNIHIIVESRKSNVIFTVKDDGVGFDSAMKRSSNGLKNMQARAGALHGNFILETSPGKGTSITVEIPAT
ncbi:tetratricopeptide repeat-containing sensor histidine kinase [Ferruginibacter sp.]